MISLAKHVYTIDYDPEALGAYGPPPPDDDHIEEVLRKGLLDRAGLDRRDNEKKFSNKDILDDD